ASGARLLFLRDVPRRRRDEVLGIARVGHRRRARLDGAARPVAREVDPEPVGENALDRDVGDLFERRKRELLAVDLELRGELLQRVSALARRLARTRVALRAVAAGPPDPGVERARRT